MRPGNAYAASKVGAEGLVHAWRHTYGYPAAIVRCTNNYGPRQHPEKAIPCWILAALSGGPLPVHGEGTCAFTMNGQWAARQRCKNPAWDRFFRMLAWTVVVGAAHDRGGVAVGVTPGMYQAFCTHF